MRASGHFQPGERLVRPSRILAAFAVFAVLSSLACAHTDGAKSPAADAAKAETEQPESEQAARTLRADANVIEKQSWLDLLRATLPSIFCSEGSYFRSCFEVTADECLKVAAESTELCLAKSEKDVPDLLALTSETSSDSAAHWSSVIGECAGSGYEESLLAKRIGGGKCDDPNAWLPEEAQSAEGPAAASAAQPAGEEAAPAPSARLVKVSKKDWIEGMRSALPANFCADGSYFRSCFKVTEKECSKVASELTVSCLEKHGQSFPQVFVQPDDGYKWGSIVGQCVGGGYEEALIQKRTGGGKCDDPSAWMPK
jgi:hypothetical protein